ncbi:hypothetical protein CLV28_2971 [Sediminihabitans luteus]|uniref:Uncharacterized protein n=1 Tax=Sediminihabitans luteus TaxID=1138585 RepID=A0A2M9CBX3_9CELL|nr:hypothetical protein [Sediminihabitans luteus]PJJ68555.1 hypothetical protein CLV28_2971 [Sediminihabitans luteus]GII99890.1 hypothetical protein Slu03_22680 [Sediminihabitans luteus]
MSEYIDVDALLRVVVAAVIVGAGLPAMFALGVRALVPSGAGRADAAGAALGESAGGSSGASAEVRVGHVGAGRRVAAVASFAVCVAAIVAGIAFIVSGGH